MTSETQTPLVAIQTSTETSELAAAMAAAQKTIQHPKKTAKVTVLSKTGGTLFAYSYATLSGVLDALRPLADNGVWLSQVPFCVGDRVGVVTTLTHKSGQWMRGTLSVPIETSDRLRLIQNIGGQITFLRRYMAQAMAGIAADDDLDANEPEQVGSVEQRAPSVAPQGEAPAVAEARAMYWAMRKDIEGAGDIDEIRAIIAAGGKTLDAIKLASPEGHRQLLAIAASRETALASMT